MPRRSRKFGLRGRSMMRNTGGFRAIGGGAVNIAARLSEARAELVAQRTGLDGQIAALDHALSMLGSRPGPRPVLRGPAPVGRPRGRGRRAGSLKQFIAKALQGRTRPMAVKDVTAAVLQAGYPTRNKTLAKSVGIALTQMSEVTKVARGLFRLK